MRYRRPVAKPVWLIIAVAALNCSGLLAQIDPNSLSITNNDYWTLEDPAEREKLPLYQVIQWLPEAGDVSELEPLSWR